MKFFDLSFPKLGEKSPKVHKITEAQLKEARVSFPRPLAERMVELGYGKWVPTDVNGMVIVTQGFVYPEQIMFFNLPTQQVKAVHVNALVPEQGPIPSNLELFCNNLHENINFNHDSDDMVDPDLYDAICTDEDQELYDLLTEADEEQPEKEVSKGKPEEKKPAPKKKPRAKPEKPEEE